MRECLRDGRYRRGIRQLTAALLFAVLANCGGSRQIQDVAEATSDGWNEALSECRNTYTDQIAQAVARAACVNKATDLLRPALPYGDLLDQENALRKSLAAQVQAGSLSLIERNRQFTKFHSRMLAEEQSRLWQIRVDQPQVRPRPRSGDYPTPRAATRWEAIPRIATDRVLTVSVFGDGLASKGLDKDHTIWHSLSENLLGKRDLP